MHGRRIYHARGKVLGGSSSINGMIFQRGNPLDYERWAAPTPGWRRGTTRIASRTSSGWRPAWPPTGDDAFRGHAGPLVLERGPATNPLFGAFFEAVQQAGYELTDDVNGYRQEGFAPFDRNIHDGQPAVGRARVPAPGDGPLEPRREDACVRDADPVRREPGRGRRVHARPRRARVDGRRGGPVRRRDQLPPDAAGLRRRRTPTSSRSSASTSWPTFPASARTSRTTSRSTSSTQHAAGLGGAVPEVAQPAVGRVWSGCSCPEGPGATNHFEGGGFVRSNDDVAYPNLMFHFLPIADPLRRLGAGERSRLPGPHRADVLRRARVGDDHLDTIRRVHPSLRFNYLSTEQDRREWVEAIRLVRRILNQPAFEPFEGGELSPGLGGRDATNRSSSGWLATARRRCTPRAPARWETPPTERSSTPRSMRVHGIEAPARRRRLGVPVHHERQHLRAGDDGGREGRRPDPRATRPRRREPSRSTVTRRGVAPPITPDPGAGARGDEADPDVLVRHRPLAEVGDREPDRDQREHGRRDEDDRHEPGVGPDRERDHPDEVRERPRRSPRPDPARREDARRATSAARTRPPRTRELRAAGRPQADHPPEVAVKVGEEEPPDAEPDRRHDRPGKPGRHPVASRRGACGDRSRSASRRPPSRPLR